MDSNFIGGDNQFAEKDFGFPYAQPYDVQLQFMQSLYKCLNGRGIGIFESPTGTGKSLSILCSSLTWLRDFEETKRCQIDGELESLRKQIQVLEASVNWVQAQTEKQKILEEINGCTRRKAALKDLDDKIRSMRQAQTQIKSRKRQTNNELSTSDKDENDDDLAPVIEDKLLKAESEPEIKPEPAPVTKIFYCSRTHSQLAQCLRELQRCRSFSSDIRVLTLGSRANMCVNDDVLKLSNNGAINDKCMHMQQASTSKVSKIEDIENIVTKRSRNAIAKCPYKNVEREEMLGEALLCKLRDNRNSMNIARAITACPYYAARDHAMPYAQLILAPYQILLHADARRAWNIDVTDAVIIIDEAHNLQESIASMHQADLNVTTLRNAQLQLSRYIDRFKLRLNGVNLMRCKQLALVIDRMLDYANQIPPEGNCQPIVKFLLESNLEDINLFNLCSYIESVQLCRKLFAFTCRYAHKPTPTEKENNKQSQPSGLAALRKKQSIPVDEKKFDSLPIVSAMYSLYTFLQALCRQEEDGRIMASRNDENISFRFLLLNAMQPFEQIVAKARSVVLAGGTMEPCDDLIYALTNQCQMPIERLHRFSCDHVVDRRNIMTTIFSTRSDNNSFDFSFTNRLNKLQLQFVIRLLIDIAACMCRGGLVVFFTSYSYMNSVMNIWRSEQLFNQLKSKFTDIFTEPRETSELDKTLQSYTSAINAAKRPVLLLAVAGGKLSEGINFSDELGRCVLMLGLPYANKHSPAMKEQLSYIRTKRGEQATNDYLTNKCMAVVNQCVGRAIRHQNDYATIILVDHRYDTPNIKNKLAGWIRKALISIDDQKSTLKHISAFYDSHCK